jgi:hypothetical protein
MVRLNGTQVGQDAFPNGERLFKHLDDLIASAPKSNIVEFFYDGPVAFEQLFMVIGYLNATHGENKILKLNWLPYLRADRLVGVDPPMKIAILELLQDVCRFRNWQISVRDPHSEVPSWIKEESIEPYIEKLLEREEIDYLCFPDTGAVERYEHLSSTFDKPYVFGIKHRDTSTGKIKEIKLAPTTPRLDGLTVLIVDDCGDYLGTANGIAKQLKEDFGAKYVILYITHASNAVLKGTAPKDHFIDKLYTTKSMTTLSPTGWMEILEIDNV